MSAPSAPAELRERTQWLVWSYWLKPGEKKPRKVPYYVSGAKRNGTQGGREDRARLSAFDRAVEALTKTKRDGTGFAFLPGDGYIGIDLDNVLDESGNLKPWARDLVESCASYTEYSPSRRGLHIIARGKCRTFKSDEIGLEVFCGSQYFTFTGERYPGTPDRVNDIAPAVLEKMRELVEAAKKKDGKPQKAAPIPNAQIPAERIPDTPDRAKVESALAHISADCGYDEWLRVGMGVHAELGEGGLEVWERWSARSAKYPGSRELATKWKSFSPAGGVTGATIFALAKEAGWRPPLRPVAAAMREAHGAPPFRATSPGVPEHLLEHAFWVREAKLNTTLPYVVKGLFGRGQIVVMWGAPGSGKSFITIELSCAIGAGLPWRGRRTKRGTVLYVAAESSRPYIENRIVALKQEWPDIAEADVVIVPLALDLLHAARGDVDRVIETAKLLTREIGDVVMIVVDTLAVTFGGGNENAPEDMGMYVANIQRIRDETRTAVLIVHHCGKNEAAGMRGHSALLGALDAELAIEGKGGEERILRSGKVRDGDGFSDLFGFRLRVVEMGLDQEGEPIRSCVSEALDAAGTQRVRRERKGAGLGKNQRAALRVIEETGGRITRPGLVQKLQAQGTGRNRAYDALASLLESGMLRAHNECIPPEVSLA